MGQTKRGGVGETPTPVDSAYFGSANANGEPSVGYLQRKSRCYELAGWALAFGNAPQDATLVHGTVDGGPGTLGRIGHAWLLLPGGLVWEPITCYVYDAAGWTHWAQARSEREYDGTQARIMLVKHGTYGRWHESEYR